MSGAETDYLKFLPRKRLKTDDELAQDVYIRAALPQPVQGFMWVRGPGYVVDHRIYVEVCVTCGGNCRQCGWSSRYIVL